MKKLKELLMKLSSKMYDSLLAVVSVILILFIGIYLIKQVDIINYISSRLPWGKTSAREEIINAPDPLDPFWDNKIVVEQNSTTLETIGKPQIIVNQPNDSEPSDEKLIMSLEAKLTKNRALMIRDANREAGNIALKRQLEVDKIFNRVYDEIPNFVNRNYNLRSNQQSMINLMSKQLLRQKELDMFLLNTALEIDAAIYDIVQNYLNEALISIELNTDTYMELKKRLPNARKICESIYRDMEKELKNTQRKNEISKFYERMYAENPKTVTISEGGFVAIVGYLYPPSLPITALGLLYLSYNKTVINNEMAEFKYELENQFRDRHDKYSELLNNSIRDLLLNYVDAITSGSIISTVYSELKL